MKNQNLFSLFSLFDCTIFLELKVSCDQCQDKCYIESTAPCYDGHIICKNCVEKCVKPIISGAKEVFMNCLFLSLSLTGF